VVNEEFVHKRFQKYPSIAIKLGALVFEDDRHHTIKRHVQKGLIGFFLDIIRCPRVNDVGIFVFEQSNSFRGCEDWRQARLAGRPFPFGTVAGRSFPWVESVTCRPFPCAESLTGPSVSLF
jgi:hypothetical protein